MRKDGLTHDHAIEASVIGYIILHGGMGVAKVHGRLKPEHFDYQAYRVLYECILDLFDKGKYIDALVLNRLMKISDDFAKATPENPAYVIMYAVTFGWMGGNIEEYCMILHELLIERETRRLTAMVGEKDAVARMGDMRKSIDSLLMLSQIDDWEDVSSVMGKLINRVDEIWANKEAVYMKTGLRFCDRLNGGFKRGQFVVIGARPGVGKSVLSGNIVIEAAKQKKKVAIINLEMDAEDVLSRMLSAESNIENHRLEQSLLKDEEERQYMLSELGKLGHLPIKFSTNTAVTINDIRAKALKLHQKDGIDLLVLDYLQLVNGALKGANRQEQVADMSRGLKLLSRELDCTVLALAQLNRTGENNISALRESGAIEQDADIVGIIDRSFDVMELNGRKVTEGTINFGKWRNGNTGKQEVYFEGSRMRFICKEDFEELGMPTPSDPSAGMTRPQTAPNLLPIVNEELPF